MAVRISRSRSTCRSMERSRVEHTGLTPVKRIVHNAYPRERSRRRGCPGDPAGLSAAARTRLRSPASSVFLSAANIWEIVIKHAAGKLRLPDEPVAYLRGRLAETPAAIIPITHEHVLQLALLPQHHRDPFDRILIAQAQVEG